MSGRPSIGEAADLLRAQLRVGQLSSPATTEDAWSAFIRFGRMRFNTADSPDADGLLFQYGVHAFDGPEAFSLDLARQFEVLGADGDYDHFVQVHCELVYEPVPALAALGDFNSWFFHDSGEDLGRWLGALTARDAWAVIREQRPVKVEVYQEAV
ncbi:MULTISPECIES: hypothetical protein [unclassified Streptomyces]|uniref:hypothetical protein n=1 Tax=unclassified Streptomyces TaxID=2593676 RepID=UPI002254F917|nr:MULTISPECIES: hypothetical protein [unclassified Streptomyces]MCX4991216.1 hypothetical protein [Streptomyces sp. NBC_00568]MCX5003547.1 hypothetical protein [Streptomyces sp. NBC_00638]